MKCTDRKNTGTILCLMCVCLLFLTGCGNLSYDLVYDTDSRISSFNVVSGQNRNVAEPFASGLCVVTDDLMDDENVDMSQASAAILFSLNDQKILYSKNAHEVL